MFSLQLFIQFAAGATAAAPICLRTTNQVMLKRDHFLIRPFFLFLFLNVLSLLHGLFQKTKGTFVNERGENNSIAAKAALATRREMKRKEKVLTCEGFLAFEGF